MTRKEDLEYVIGKTMVLRLTWREALARVKTELDRDISQRRYNDIKKELMTKGRTWVQYMQVDHDAFLNEYQQRYTEMWHSQQRLQRIAEATEKDKPDVSTKATMGYHQITNDMARLVDLIPYVAGGVPRYNIGKQFTTTNNQRLEEDTATEDTGAIV